MEIKDQIRITITDTGAEGEGDPQDRQEGEPHDGGRPGPGFSLLPDWSTYE